MNGLGNRFQRDFGAGNTCLCRSAITLADSLGVQIASLAEVLRSDHAGYPNLRRRMDSMKARPSSAKVNVAIGR
jgi:glutathione S-transferase